MEEIAASCRMNSLRIAYLIIWIYLVSQLFVPFRSLLSVPFLFLVVALRPDFGSWPLLNGVPRSYSDTPHSVGLLWTSDQPDAKISIWHHTTLITEISMSPGGFWIRNPSKLKRLSVRTAPQLQTIFVSFLYRVAQKSSDTQHLKTEILCQRLLATLCTVAHEGKLPRLPRSCVLLPA